MNSLLQFPNVFALAIDEGAPAESASGAIGWKFLAIFILIALKGLFVAAEFALVKVRASRRGEEFAFPDVPFGVFLAPAALLTLLWGDALIRWYVDRAFSA